MKALSVLIFVSLLSSISFSMPRPIAHFKNGNDISIKEMSGSVTYYCQDNAGRQYTRHWSCYAADVNPGTHDYLVTETPVDANKVTLTCDHKDGSTKTKSASFDGQSSTSKFNLLTSSLTQRPLLKAGANLVTYKLTKGKDVVEEGTFQSNVNVLESKQCRYRAEFAYAPNDDVCQFESFGCDRYFYMENYCNY
jgi:hypothetical protein